MTARALSHGLATRPPKSDVAAELVELARADRRVLAQALARVERGLAERWSLVGARARDAIEQALARVALEQALAQVPGEAASIAPLVSPPVRSGAGAAGPLGGAGDGGAHPDPGPSALPCR